jgi:hypothetical protein
MINKGFFVGCVGRGNRCARRRSKRYCFGRMHCVSKTKRHYQCSFTKLNKSRKHELNRKWMFFIVRYYWANAVEFEKIKSAMMNKVARELGYRSVYSKF